MIWGFAGKGVVSHVGLRVNRARRLVRRIREAPWTFLMWKLMDRLSRSLWSVCYSANAHFGRRFDSLLCGEPEPSVLDCNSARMARSRAILEELGSVGHPLIAAIVDRALLARAHKVQVLGFGLVDLGMEIDWSRDYISGYQWPRRAALRLDYVKAFDPCDVKVAWEINRLHFLTWMAQAWVCTKEREYLHEVAEVLDRWDRCNPLGMGIAWACPMEVSIRAMNLIYLADLCASELAERERKILVRLISAHYRYLRRHSEASDVNGNHHLVNLGALAQLGTICSGSEPNREFRRFVDELGNQIGLDGMHHEFSTNYHRLMTELVMVTLHRIRYSAPTGGDSERCVAHLDRMLTVVNDLALSSGELPLIGDSDSGHCVVLGVEDPNSVRWLLDAGSRLVSSHIRLRDRSELAAGTSDVFIGERVEAAPEVFARPSTTSSRAFSPSGYVILCQGETKLITRAGPCGLRGRASHDHSDLTSFVLDMAQGPIVVDPGTSTYTGSRDVRRKEISASSHNMLLVDGIDPAPVLPGSIVDVVSPRTVGSIIVPPRHCNGAEELSVSHNGFDRLVEVDSYTRRFSLEGSGRICHVTDAVTGAGEHLLSARITIDPVWRIRKVGRVAFELYAAERDEAIRVTGHGWTQADVHTCEIAPHYGQTVLTSAVLFTGLHQLPIELRIVLEDLSCP